jgi:hypothetical protein
MRKILCTPDCRTKQIDTEFSLINLQISKNLAQNNS